MNLDLFCFDSYHEVGRNFVHFHRIKLGNQRIFGHYAEYLVSFSNLNWASLALTSPVVEEYLGRPYRVEHLEKVPKR